MQCHKNKDNSQPLMQHENTGLQIPLRNIQTSIS